MATNYLVRQVRPMRVLARGALIVALALVMGAVGVAALGSGRLFSAGDSGLNDPAARSFAVQGSTAVTHGDVTLSVDVVLADPIQTAVEILFQGLPDGWAAIPASGRPYLEDADGTRTLLRQAGVSGDNAHASTFVFESLAGARAPIEMVIPGLGAENLGGSPVDAPSLYDGEWRVALPFEGLDPAQNRLPAAVRRDFGPGLIVVDSVIVAPTGILVEGHLEGFTRDDVMASVLVPARLTNDAGDSAAQVGGYQGRGEDEMDFGLRFPPLAGYSLDFEVSLNPAAGSGASPRLGPYFGARVVVPIDLR